MKRFLLPALLAPLAFGAGIALAQGTAPASGTKKELVARLLKLQQPGIEALGRTLAEEPAKRLVLTVQSSGVIQRIAADKRDALSKELDAELKKYIDEAVPLLRDRAVQLAPATMGPVLEQHFSEDELRQLIAMLESPLNAKYQAAAGEMQKALGERLIGETKGSIEPKVQALQRAVSNRVNAAAGASAAGASGARR